MKPCFKQYGQALALAFCLLFQTPCLAESGLSDQSLEELRIAAEKGSAQSQYLLGCRFFYGDESTGIDYKLAAEWFRKGAESGHAGSQSILGYIYMTAYGVSPDTTEGMKWLQKAAEKNDASAQYSLGAFYEMGRGIEMDRFTAMDWYMKAAAQGHTAAKEDLKRLRQTADSARHGIVSNEWWLASFEDLVRKAEQGDAAAQENLGNRYKGYGGTEMDFEKAKYWFEKAASQTNRSSARYHLSQLYVSATNVAPDQAFYHCSLAAAGGYSLALRTLGEYYRDGFGTSPDRGKALHWLCQAERSGDDRAGKSIYALIRGRAKFKETNGKLRVQASDDYSSPPVEIYIHDLENNERMVRFLKYDPKTKQVETDYMFGQTNWLPLSAFQTNSHAVIQSDTMCQAFKNMLDLSIDEKKLDRTDLEKLDAVSGKIGGTDFKYTGLIYGLKLKNNGNTDLVKMDIEYRYFFEVKEIWRTMEAKNTSTPKVEKGAFKVEILHPGTEYEKETKPFVLKSSYLPSGTYYIGGAAEVVESRSRGLWMRVSCVMADGCRIYRDICDPESLSSKITWPASQ